MALLKILSFKRDPDEKAKIRALTTETHKYNIAYIWAQ